MMDETEIAGGPTAALCSQEVAMPASRTPEGEPTRCAVCGAEHAVDFSATGGDSSCPACGCLLWQGRTQAARLHRRLSQAFGAEADELTPDTPLADFADDSLSMVELVMELEEELEQQGVDTQLTPDEANRCRTVGDALRLLMQRRRAAGLD